MSFFGCLLLAMLSEPGVRVDEDPPAGLVVQSARPDGELDGLFQRSKGWIGGDGVQSVALGAGKTLWLFSDTWVGTVRNGKRTDATIVNNTLAIQSGARPGAKLDYVIRHNKEGKPAAFCTPADGKGWFWLQAGIRLGDKLYLFLVQVEKTNETSVFGFRVIGQWLGIVSNPDDPPLSWKMEQRKLPNTIYSPQRELTFGCAVLVLGEDLYIYGTDEDVLPASRQRHLIVARVSARQVEDFSAWRYYRKGEWVADFQQAERVVGNMASEYSVMWMPERRQYLLVYTEKGLSDRILARVSASPTGPWSNPTLLYRCPEMKEDKKLFCYNGKAHASLSSRDEVVINYVVNSFDFWQVAREARLYWPRFVRVRLGGK